MPLAAEIVSASIPTGEPAIPIPFAKIQTSSANSDEKIVRGRFQSGKIVPF